jgi:hypothetical protein
MGLLSNACAAENLLEFAVFFIAESDSLTPGLPIRQAPGSRATEAGRGFGSFRIAQ